MIQLSEGWEWKKRENDPAGGLSSQAGDLHGEQRAKKNHKWERGTGGRTKEGCRRYRRAVQGTDSQERTGEADTEPKLETQKPGIPQPCSPGRPVRLELGSDSLSTQAVVCCHLFTPIQTD